MKLTNNDQQSITAMLTSICHELASIETEYGLLVGEGDYRPRIEYFHDAVRAVSSGENLNRLSVEALSYDVVALRKLQQKPLIGLTSKPVNLSSGTDIIQTRPGELAPSNKRPDRTVRDRLSELYQNYAVMFSALLRPTAENDYLERTEGLNQEVEEIIVLIAELERFKSNQGDVHALIDIANHLESEELRTLLSRFVQEAKYKNKGDIDKLIAFLKFRSDQDDKDIRTIDDAHKNYTMGQLGLYEESRDMLKKMASSGVNLVGNFVENALRNNTQGRGR